MAIFTSSLPDDLLKRLANASLKMKLPKDKLIEKALDIYLEQLDRDAYLKSYKKMAKDEDMILMAEEGMADYLQQFQDLEKTFKI